MSIATFPSVSVLNQIFSPWFLDRWSVVAHAQHEPSVCSFFADKRRLIPFSLGLKSVYSCRAKSKYLRTYGAMEYGDRQSRWRRNGLFSATEGWYEVPRDHFPSKSPSLSDTICHCRWGFLSVHNWWCRWKWPSGVWARGRSRRLYGQFQRKDSVTFLIDVESLLCKF